MFRITEFNGSAHSNMRLRVADLVWASAPDAFEVLKSKQIGDQVRVEIAATSALWLGPGRPAPDRASTDAGAR